jgi:uncharacterized protein YcaQ
VTTLQSLAETPPAVVQLSAAEARRIALAAQGFGGAPPRATRVDRRHLRRVLDRIGLIQIDSVNVLVRSHYLPLYSRLGAYPRVLLDRMAYSHRELFEYWGHECSLLPVALHPLLRWRMERAGRGEAYVGLVRWARQKRGYIEAVRAEVAARGALAASELSEPGARRGPWWGWANGKRALEWLYWTGQVTVASRRHFERIYDLPERVLPAGVLATPTPEPHEAQRALLRIAARALGVGTARDLADYFRLRVPEARPRLAELVEAGELLSAEVEGWRSPAFLDPGARAPRALEARALLSPFDSLVWERARAERLFGFHLRIELYTPAAQRRFGYYVLPFLLGDRLVARVDLQADRARRTLRVRGAFLEPGAATAEVAAALAPELRRLAGWLGLDRILIGRRGALTGPLRRALAAAG